MIRLMGVFAIVPVTILLTISFFVLFALRKTDAVDLKAFGWVIVALLWFGAVLFFSLGIYTVTTGRHPMAVAMQEIMECKMQMMQGGCMPKPAPQMQK